MRDTMNDLRGGSELIRDYRLFFNTKRFQKLIRNAFMEKHGGAEPQKYQFSVDTPRGSRYLFLKVRSPNPVEAAELVNLTGPIFFEEIGKILGIKNYQIIDEAEVPKNPVYPKTKRITFFGALLGAFAVAGFCLLRFLWDTRLCGTEDFQKWLQVPLLEVIPFDPVLNRQLKKDRNTRKIVSTLSGAEDSRHMNIAEAFRMLRNNLRYINSKKSRQGRVFVLTSSVPGEGKTFNSANIAVSFAELGFKTLAVNCDLYKPQFHTVFSIQKSQGLTDIIAEGASFEECVVHDAIPGLPLDVLLGGPIAPNPAKLLCSDEFSNLLNVWRGMYDYVILDAPPVSAVADAAIVGKTSDGVILVTRYKVTREEFLKAAYKQLQMLEIGVIGIVMNGVIQRDGHGYGYGYGYGYGCEEPVKKSLWAKLWNKSEKKKHIPEESFDSSDGEKHSSD